MGWLMNMIDRWSIEKQRKEMLTFVHILSSMDGHEIGLVMALATHMRHGFEETGCNFMEPMVYAQKNPAVIISLRKIITDFQKQGRMQDAGALMIWLHTLRAGLFLDLRGTARAMWGQLSRGFPYIEDSSLGYKDRSGQPFNISGANQFPGGFTPTPL